MSWPVEGFPSVFASTIFADITIFPGVAAFQTQKPTINAAGNNNCARKLPAAPCAAMPIASGEASGGIAIIAMKSWPNIAMSTRTSTMVTQILSMTIARKRAQKPTYRGSATPLVLLVICSSICAVRIVDVSFRFDAQSGRITITLSIACDSMRT